MSINAGYEFISPNLFYTEITEGITVQHSDCGGSVTILSPEGDLQFGEYVWATFSPGFRMEIRDSLVLRCDKCGISGLAYRGGPG